MSTWGDKDWIKELSIPNTFYNTSGLLLDVEDPPEGLVKSTLPSQFNLFETDSKPIEEELVDVKTEANELTIDFASLLSINPQKTQAKPIQVNCTLADLVAGEKSTVFRYVLAELSNEKNGSVISFSDLVKKETMIKESYNLNAPEFKPPTDIETTIETTDKKKSVFGFKTPEKNTNAINIRSPEQPAFESKLPKKEAIAIRSPSKPAFEFKLPNKSHSPVSIHSPEPAFEFKWPNKHTFEFKPKAESVLEFKPKAEPTFEFKISTEPSRIKVRAPEAPKDQDNSKEKTTNKTNINLDAPEFKPTKDYINLDAPVFKPPKEPVGVYHNGLFIPTVEHF